MKNKIDYSKLQLEEKKIFVEGDKVMKNQLFVGENQLNFVSLVEVGLLQLREDAIEPRYEHDEYGNSGMDLFAAAIAIKEDGEWKEFDSLELAPGETALVKTGFAMEIPYGLELQVRPTSGNSLKTKMRVANSPGTIDASYRGEIGVIVENIGDINILLTKHAKVAQGVLCPVFHAKFKKKTKLSETSRGKDGYGSTGTINKEEK